MCDAVLQIRHKMAASAQFVMQVIHGLTAHPLGFVFFIFTTRQQKLTIKILNPNLSAASAPTLPQCDAASTSALLLGHWPTNPLTP